MQPVPEDVPLAAGRRRSGAGRRNLQRENQRIYACGEKRFGYVKFANVNTTIGRGIRDDVEVRAVAIDVADRQSARRRTRNGSGNLYRNNFTAERPFAECIDCGHTINIAGSGCDRFIIKARLLN